MAKSLLFTDRQDGDGYLNCPKSDLGGAGSSSTDVIAGLELAIPCTMVNLLRSEQLLPCANSSRIEDYPKLDMCDRAGFEGSNENDDETGFYDSSIDMNGYWGTVDTIATASVVARDGGRRKLQDGKYFRKSVTT